MDRSSGFEVPSRSAVHKASPEGIVFVPTRSAGGEIAIASADLAWMGEGRWESFFTGATIAFRFCQADVELAGRITDVGGNPVANATVACRTSETISEPDGMFRLRVALDYSRQIEARKDGYSPVSQELRIENPGSYKQDLVLRPALKIEGVVLDDINQAVQGAGVTGGAGFGIASTDAFGRFVAHVDEDNRAVIVAHPAFPLLQYNIPKGWVAPTPVRIVLSRGADLRGTVRNESGEGIGGARIAISGGLDERYCVSDAGGEFCIGGVPKVEVRLVVRADGYVPTELDGIRCDEGSIVDCVVRRGSPIYGFVYGDTKQPCSGATVRVMKGWSASNVLLGRYDLIDVVVTDNRGAFTIPAVRERAAIEVACDGYETKLLYDIGGADPSRPPIVVDLVRSAYIAGVVMDSATSEPLTEFNVRMVDPEIRPGEIGVANVRSGWREGGVKFKTRNGTWSTAGESLVLGAIAGLEISAAGYETARVPRAIAGALTGAPIAIRLRRHN